jgi:hypothetical protein
MHALRKKVISKENDELYGKSTVNEKSYSTVLHHMIKLFFHTPSNNVKPHTQANMSLTIQEEKRD